MLHNKLPTEFVRLLILLKVIRLITAFKLLSHKTYIKEVKSIVGMRVKAIIEKNKKEENEEDLNKDHNYISFVVLTSHILKTLYLVLLLLCVSYFSGLLWYLLSDMFGKSLFIDHQQSTLVEAFFEDFVG